jgi:hypothetical protein
MVGRTRLHQSTGSPLISGRTVLERPLWRDWVTSVIVGLVFAAVTALLPAAREGSIVFGVWGRAFSQLWSGIWVVVAIVFGALAGCVLARAWGAVRTWILGSLAAILAGWVTALALVLVWLH